MIVKDENGIARNELGQFVKGHVANPSGRPKRGNL